MTTSLAERLNDDLSEAVGKAHGSLVRVLRGGRGIGSGVVWDASGRIVTNAHVARGRGELGVILADGSSADAELVAMDEDADVAFLTAALDSLEPVELGDARALRPGEFVLALGFPWGITDAVSSGVVVGMEDWAADEGRDSREWLVVNMRLRPGNSGGPVVDSHGRLVGLSTIMAGPDVGMAVPVHVAQGLAATL